MKRVLVIDDSASARFLVRSVLQEIGLEVCEAENGLKGLEKVTQFKPHLVITDVNMPIADGFKVCSILKSNNLTKRIPVIMLTTRGESTSLERGMAAGADHYVVKPFVAAEFTQLIGALLDSLDRRQEEVTAQAPAASGREPRPRKIKLAVVAGGFGGLQSLQRILVHLTRKPGFPVLVALPIPRFACQYHATQLNDLKKAAFVRAEPGLPLTPGFFHMLSNDALLVPVVEGGDLVLRDWEAATGMQGPEESTRLDSLFEAAALAAGSELVGVLLSGITTDGVVGIKTVLAKQGESYCEALGTAMGAQLPRAALAAGAVQVELDYAEIAAVLSR